MRKITLLISALLILCVTVSAHSGKTDANGGHYDHSTGEYHFHHGFPAHQHTGGVCPYDFVDITGADSGGSGDSGGFSSGHGSPAEPNPVETLNQEKGIGTGGKITLIAFLGIFVVYPAVLFVWMVVQGVIASVQKRNKEKQAGTVTVSKVSARPQPPAPQERVTPEWERPGFVNLLEGRSIWETAEVPDWAYFDQHDLPHTLTSCLDGPDPFIVCAAPGGECYHRPNCRMARGAVFLNVCTAQMEGKRPCKVCKPMEQLPDFVKRYQQIRGLQRSYRIRMLP